MNPELERLATIARATEQRVNSYADIIATRYACSVGPVELTATEQQVFAQVKRDAHLARMTLQFYCAGRRDGIEGNEPSKTAALFTGFPDWGLRYREGYEHGQAERSANQS